VDTGGAPQFAGVHGCRGNNATSTGPLRSGAVDCWGLNQNGQLGDGTTKNSDRPVAVMAVGGSGPLSGVAEVQPEVYGFCAALSSGGAVCWGLNEEGELGDNSLTGPQLCGAIDTQCAKTPVTVTGTAGTGALGQVAARQVRHMPPCALN
jgi:alpha-tubulin suppressor-like RCC1 family protein